MQTFFFLKQKYVRTIRATTKQHKLLVFLLLTTDYDEAEHLVKVGGARQIRAEFT